MKFGNHWIYCSMKTVITIAFMSSGFVSGKFCCDVDMK